MLCRSQQDTQVTIRLRSTSEQITQGRRVLSKLEGKVAVVTGGGPAAVYLVSDASRHLSGHRLVATGGARRTRTGTPPPPASARGVDEVGEIPRKARLAR